MNWTTLSTLLRDTMAVLGIERIADLLPTVRALRDLLDKTTQREQKYLDKLREVERRALMTHEQFVEFSKPGLWPNERMRRCALCLAMEPQHGPECPLKGV